MIKTDNAYFMFKITLQTHTNYIQIYRTLYYNPSVNFCGLYWLKMVMWQVARWLSKDYPHSELISVWFYFDRRKNWKRANVWAKIFNWSWKTKKKNPTAEASDGKIISWLSISYQETRKKSTKYAGTADLRAFPLRNLSEGYKINKTFSGLLIYRGIMPSADRLSSNFHH